MKRILLLSLFVCFTIIIVLNKDNLRSSYSKLSVTKKKKLKLYWFIPDGFRAEPSTFTLFKWAQEGKLPNIKKLMNQGSYGYSIPVFPGHTPTNFATLLTGSTPKTHGVADGPMRIEGYPLKMVSKGGFSSTAKKVAPIWYTLEEQGYRSALLSIPGSTPPELFNGITIRGRWGGWGVDFTSVIFNSDNDKKLRVRQGTGDRIFYFGSNLTSFGKATVPKGWKIKVRSYSDKREVELSNWGAKLYCLLIDSTNDNIENYDRILISKNKKDILAIVNQGNWSKWLPAKLYWQTQNDYNTKTPKKSKWERKLSQIEIDSQLKIRVIKLGKKNFYRIRILYNNLNKYLIDPFSLYDDVNSSLGPMIDFVDNYPPQLIYYPEDKIVFKEEAQMSIDWHKKMVTYMRKEYDVDVIIHNIYTPNQMLTSRWWMGKIDPESPYYKSTSLQTRENLWNDVLKMYQGIDQIIGKIIDTKDPNTYIVLSSDHGAVPLHTEVRLNNLFSKKGWLKYKINPKTGEYIIDWKNSKVIYLKMDNIFINPKGLSGPFYHAKGKEFEKLRDKVIKVLNEIKTNSGEKVLAKVTKRENALYLDLPKDRVGDLIIANVAGFGWIEEISSDLKLFKKPLKSGYKQAILPNTTQGMWTPFIISGPNIKKNFKIPKPIRHIDQYPTIMTLLRKKIPNFVEGKVLKEIFENK